jgi:hypothetical protein
MIIRDGRHIYQRYGSVGENESLIIHKQLVHNVIIPSKYIIDGKIHSVLLPVVLNEATAYRQVKSNVRTHPAGIVFAILGNNLP